MCSIDVLCNKKIYEIELSRMKEGGKKLVLARRDSSLIPG